MPRSTTSFLLSCRRSVSNIYHLCSRSTKLPCMHLRLVRPHHPPSTTLPLNPFMVGPIQCTPHLSYAGLSPLNMKYALIILMFSFLLSFSLKPYEVSTRERPTMLNVTSIVSAYKFLPKVGKYRILAQATLNFIAPKNFVH